MAGENHIMSMKGLNGLKQRSVDRRETNSENIIL